MTIINKIFVFNSLLATFLIFNVPVSMAQDGIVLPQPLVQLPSDFISPDREALVHVRFTVKADGTTSDVEVIGGFSNDQYDEAAVSTVEAWTFTPATNNGAPIDFLNQELLLPFYLTDGTAISPQVVEAYEQFSQLMSEQKYEEVINQIETMLEGSLTLFDYAFLHDILAGAYMGDNKIHEALASSKRATYRLNGRDLLSPELLTIALRKRFLLSASQSQNADAYDTYERLMALSALSDNDPIQAQARAIKEKIDSPEPLGLIGKLTDGTWKFPPSRRIIAITEVNGNIDTVDIRCQRRNVELAFEPGVEWNLPASFGDCEMEFSGNEGTEFTLYEFSE